MQKINAVALEFQLGYDRSSLKTDCFKQFDALRCSFGILVLKGLLEK